MGTRYLIVNAFSSRNAGDAAIVLATGELLRRNGSEQIVSATRYHDEDESFYESHGIATTASVIPFPRRSGSGHDAMRALVFVAGTIAAFLLTFLHRAKPRLARKLAIKLRLEGLDALFESDRSIVCGGGYLYSSRRPLNLTLLHASLCVKVCELAGKRPVMMPQSIGPFSRKSDSAIVSRSFSGVEPIVVRDHAAFEVASRIGADGQEVILCPDIALLGWRNEGPDRVLEQRTKPIVGIAPMDWTWARKVNSEVALDEYIERLVEIARQLDDSGVEVRLYGNSRMPEMQQDDLATAARILEKLETGTAVLDPEGASGSAPLLYEAFRGLDAVIGTRLHGCIISLAAGTPSIALGYQPKTEGTYRQLDLDRLCFDVETFEPGAVAELANTLTVPGSPTRQEVLHSVDSAQQLITSTYGDILRT